MLVLALSGLLLNACSYSVQVLSTPSAAPIVATQAVIIPTELPTEVPAALITPTVTPTLIPIRVDRLTMLEIFESFQLGDSVRSITFTPDGTTLAAAGGNTGEYGIHLWDVVSGQTVGILGWHHDIVWDLAFSPDGNLLASVSSDGTAQVHDWRTGDVEKVLNFPAQVVRVGFSPDGQTLAVGGVDTSQNQIQNAAVWMYTVGSWSPLFKLPEYMNITAMAYSPTNGVIIGGGTSRNVQVWRTDTGAPLFTLSHAHQVSKAVISPDGSTVATATCATVTNGECTEGGVWLWDLPTGKLLRKLGGFPSVVENLVYLTDGTALIAGSRDGTLRVYITSNIASGYSPVLDITAPGGVSALAVSPDGTLLATGNNNGDVNIWKIVDRP
jgi:WD40 repeat protein